jgi:hypothetical protein
MFDHRHPRMLGHEADQGFTTARDGQVHDVGELQQLEHVFVPLAGADVEQQCAARVAGVGQVLGAAGQLPGEPAVDGAKGEFTALGPTAQQRIAVQQPRELGAGKIGIEQQAGATRDLGLVSVRLEAGAQVRGAAPARRWRVPRAPLHDPNTVVSAGW